MRLSAGIVVVHLAEDKIRYLLLRAYRNWDFPKGMIEPGESALDAARRELVEETGLTSPDFRWGEIFYETPSYAKDKIARYYLAASTTAHVHFGINPQLGRAEHHEYRWVDYLAAQTLLVPRVRAALDWADGIVTKS